VRLNKRRYESINTGWEADDVPFVDRRHGGRSAYLSLDARSGTRFPWWRSRRWWLASFAALIILFPLFSEFMVTWSGSFGLRGAFRTVLIPWAAGLGFGIWLYLIIGPFPQDRSSAVAQRLAGEGPAAARQDPSFIPIGITMLLVILIISEDQYGWLARLQKLTFGGGGVEFAARSTANATQPIQNAGALPGNNTGDRVTALVKFMAPLDITITRDIGYAEELGCKGCRDDFKNDLDFASRVVVPLGKHLDIIHKARGYNKVGLLIGPSLIDDFRSFILDHRDGVTLETTEVTLESERRRLAKEVGDKIVYLWLEVCLTEMRLRLLGAIASEDEDWVKKCKDHIVDAARFMDLWLSPAGKGIALNRALPYGTLLAAMFLNAGDELDSAVRDLDEWVSHNDSEPKPSAEFYKWMGVYRALYQSALLLIAEDRPGATEYLIIEHSRRLKKISEMLVSSTFPAASSPSSWQAQRRRLERIDRFDPLWEMGFCPNDLTENFKKNGSSKNRVGDFEGS
jgi:hypothetical protein